MKNMLTRRDFLQGTTAALLGSSLRRPGLGRPQEGASMTRVVLVRDAGALDAESSFNAGVIARMLDDAVTRLADESDPVKAWGRFIRPEDVVGVKTNVWSYLPTPKEVEEAVRRRLLDVGVREENLAFDDHTVRTNPVFLRSTAIVNVRPLRTHYLAGVSGTIKNYIMFAPSQEALHPDSCADLATTFFLPQVKGKNRLNILCALTPQFHGRGPHNFNRRYVWSYKGLIVGRDPVAVDTIGLRLIMAKRRIELGKAQELPPVPKHIQLADTRHRLGTSDMNRIELVKLGWAEDILV
jgi:hypothetical protein